jgi:hypothetical protein
VPERNGDLEESLRASNLSWQEIADTLFLSKVVTEQVLPPDDDATTARPEDRASAARPQPESPPVEPSVVPAPTAARRMADRKSVPATGGTGGGSAWTMPRRPWSLAMTRALRPLRRVVASDQDGVLDEERTAEQAVQADLWLPVFEPARERWPDVVMVVDDNPTIALWHATVEEFGKQLRRVGAFRTVQTRRIRAVDGKCALWSGTAEVSTRSLVDSTGRRLVLVLTDGIGEAWRTGAAQAMVHQWAASQPVAVVHLLPQRIWAHSQVRPRRARLRAPAPFAPNRAVTYKLLDTWLDDDEEHRDRSLPVPVVELDERSLRQWGRFLGSRGGWTDLPVLLTGSDHQPEPDDPAEDLAPRDRVARFRAMATPTAFTLAATLAATPLSVPSMLAVQHALVPTAEPAHLAELMVSGLVKPTDLGEITLDFVDGVRSLLLSHARRAETLRAVQVAVSHFGDRVPALSRLGAALDDPDTADLADVEPAPFAALTDGVLRALSGRYATPARRLSSAAEPTTTDVDRSSESRSEAVQAEPGLSLPEIDNHRRAAPPEFEVPQPAAPAAGDVRPPEPVVGHWTPAGRLVGGDIPLRRPDFVGRGDLLRDLDHLLPDGGVVTLTGMGGVGKSQVAAEYVHRHLDDYDLVWWVSAHHATSIRAEMVNLARAMDLRCESAAQAISAVHAVLRAGQPYRRWLLVLDDVGDPGLHGFLPTGGGGACLLTSRDPQWASMSRSTRVDVLDREQSVELLVNRTHLPAADMGLVAEALGDLPLALDQAASWLNATGMPVPEYLNVLTERPGVLLFEQDHALRTTWSQAVDMLASTSPEAYLLLQLCALAPGPLAPSRLYAIRHELPFLPKELALALLDSIRLGWAIRALTQRSLVRLDHARDRIEVHPVLRAFVRYRTNEFHREWLVTGARLLLDEIGQPS